MELPQGVQQALHILRNGLVPRVGLGQSSGEIRDDHALSSQFGGQRRTHFLVAALQIINDEGHRLVFAALHQGLHSAHAEVLRPGEDFDNWKSGPFDHRGNHLLADHRRIGRARREQLIPERVPQLTQLSTALCHAILCLGGGESAGGQCG